MFTGDNTVCDALWTKVNEINNLKYIIIETAFSNKEYELAALSKHLCPSILVVELTKFKANSISKPAINQALVEAYITHLKPGEGEIIMQEIATSGLTPCPQALKNNQVFNL